MCKNEGRVAPGAAFFFPVAVSRAFPLSRCHFPGPGPLRGGGQKWPVHMRILFEHSKSRFHLSRNPHMRASPGDPNEQGTYMGISAFL